MDPTRNDLVTIFGGSGFLGTQVVQLLARKGYRIRVAVRRPDLAGHLKPLGTVGQIVPIQANLRNTDSVRRAVAGAGIVINLGGLGFQRGKQRFDAIHVEGARAVADAARATGAKRLVHVSILGADPQSESALVRSRAEGEAQVLAGFPGAVILRPSIMFGQGDGYFNLFGTLARLCPALPLIGGKSRLQPVYVGDVADAVLAAAEGVGKGIYELGGPEIETQRQLIERVLRESGRNRPLIPLPDGIASLLALPMALLPTPLLTGDQVIQLQTDNVVSETAIREKRTLSAFGVTPTPMDAILPSYLWRFRKHGQFDKQVA
jgi:NADH dehydrogenase